MDFQNNSSEARSPASVSWVSGHMTIISQLVHIWKPLQKKPEIDIKTSLAGRYDALLKITVEIESIYL